MASTGFMYPELTLFEKLSTTDCKSNTKGLYTLISPPANKICYLMVIYENYSHCGVSNKYRGNGRSDSAFPITCLCINTVQ